MKYLHEHKKEFAMGVLTSIVATTIMDTIKKSFEVVGDSFIPSWTNAIYRRASQITHYTVVEWLVLTVLCVLFFIAIIEIADFAKKISLFESQCQSKYQYCTVFNRHRFCFQQQPCNCSRQN